MQPLLEYWKPVPGFEETHAVSNTGRVRRLTPFKNVTFLAPRHHSAGYTRYSLGRNGVTFYKYGHELVMTAFVGKRPSGLVINHKDNNKKNNRLSNLEYITQAENMAHAASLGLMPVGEANHRSRFTANEVQAIRELNKTLSIYKIAHIYDVGWETISRIVKRRVWRHIA